jgi:phosphatidate cytidylyltransferase
VNNFWTRTIAGIVFVALLAGAVLLHPLAVAVLFLAVAVIGYLEFHKLFTNKPFPTLSMIVGLMTGAGIYVLLVLAAFQMMSFHHLALILPLLFFPFLAALLRTDVMSLTQAVISTLGVLYIFIPLALLNFYPNPAFVEGQYEKSILLGFLIMVWTNDSFAYLTGKLIGKHKLYEKVSPKKTWEGSIGGLVFSMVAAYILSLFFPVLSTSEWLTMSILTVIFGVIGDLFESLMKRMYGLKDSGNIIPGHGGVLDRFDALFFSSPMVFVYLFEIYS